MSQIFGHNRNPNQSKFMKPKLSVVIITSFLTIFLDFAIYLD